MKQLCTLIIAAGLFFSASAQNSHLLDQPTITTTDHSLTVCGSIVGLGNNQLVIVSVSAPATTTTTCTNNGGQLVEAQGSTQTVSSTGKYLSDKNGRVNFCQTVEGPAGGNCPSGKWTSVTSTDFGQVTITVNGKVVYH